MAKAVNVDLQVTTAVRPLRQESSPTVQNLLVKGKTNGLAFAHYFLYIFRGITAVDTVEETELARAVDRLVKVQSVDY